MLVLTRKVGESIVIDGHITVRVISTGRNRVRLAIDAPPNIRVLRNELTRGCDEAMVVQQIDKPSIEMIAPITPC